MDAFPDISRLGSAIEQASKDCNLPSRSREIAELSYWSGVFGSENRLRDSR